MNRVLFLCSAAVLVAAICPALAVDSPQIQPDIVYGHKDGMALTFDVLTPAAPNGAAVLHLQSGGWYSPWQPPQELIGAERPWLDAGYTVFIVRHGSAPKYTVPEAVADVRHCVRYIRLHAGDFGVDANRLGVTGGSAGGHLTLMLATTGDDGDPAAQDPVLQTSSRIACGVSLYPPTDLRGWTTDPPAEIKKHAGLKPPLSFDSKLEDSVSPILAVTADDAPVLMIHGDQDLLVPIEHSRNIVPKFQEVGAVAELLTIEGAAHGYSPEQNQMQVLPAMLGWFEKYLQAKPAEAKPAAAAPNPFARDQLVAWCIVPFDAQRRGPAERAEMLQRLGLRRVAYDWRAEHVPTFEQEILEYQRCGLEFFAFWGTHDEAFRLFRKFDLHPQIWQTLPNPPGETDAARLTAAVEQLLPLVEQTRALGSQLGIYNHGGWGGEPTNMAAICRTLREQHDAGHVGIVYNLHHGHDHVADFAAHLATMKPFLLCLNLNGMTPHGDQRGQKILPIGAGEDDLRLLQLIEDSGYSGPIGVIGHTQDDVEQRLQDNLDGLAWLLPQLDGAAAGPSVAYRTHPVAAVAP